jgi:hypothetical protein
MRSTPPERLAQLRAQGFNPVFDPILDPPDATASIIQDPITGIKTYHPATGVYAAAASVGGPPSIQEPPPSRFFPISHGITINRYSLNPARDFYSQLLSGVATLVGDPPSMFGSGDLPVFTASGLDPSMLRWVDWAHRHSAAVAETRSQVLLLIEQGLAGAVTVDDFQSAEGVALWGAYWQRVTAWVQTVPPDETTASIDAQLQAVYGSNTSQQQ